MIHGVINVYKESGYTSHDVVNRLRRILGQKKIGHTGTLDPEATGVLPVCLGAATRLCDLFADAGKEYLALLRLGIVTDTQDMTGEILQRLPVHVTEEELRRAAASFVGTYEQMPPMYSAVKVNGRKLYEFARRGIEVERKSRTVTIDQLTVEQVKLPCALLRVSCSKGTYIRTLCADLGEALGCGGCVETLTRTRVGSFSLEHALRLEEIAAAYEHGTLSASVRPIDTFFPEAAKARVEEKNDFRLWNGNQFFPEELSVFDDAGAKKDAADDGTFFYDQLRLYDSKGCFLGVYLWDHRRRFYHPRKMFLPL